MQLDSVVESCGSCMEVVLSCQIDAGHRTAQLDKTPQTSGPIIHSFNLPCHGGNSGERSNGRTVSLFSSCNVGNS